MGEAAVKVAIDVLVQSAFAFRKVDIHIDVRVAILTTSSLIVRPEGPLPQQSGLRSRTGPSLPLNYFRALYCRYSKSESHF